MFVNTCKYIETATFAVSYVLWKSAQDAIACADDVINNVLTKAIVFEPTAP
jgi:hypothetical protein